jgi:surface polysaccharide O-acyltransferase-like enzyme
MYLKTETFLNKSVFAIFYSFRATKYNLRTIKGIFNLSAHSLHKYGIHVYFLGE